MGAMPVRRFVRVNLSIIAFVALIATESALFGQSAPADSGPSTRPAKASQAAPPSAAPQRVLNVTTLQDYGPNERPIPGSIRYVLERARGPAIIRFTVGGGIHLKNKLVIHTPFLAIDGSTAPAPGITFLQHQVEVADTHHIVLRHLRFRCGDGFPNDSARQAVHGRHDRTKGTYTTGWRSLLVIANGNRPTHDVLIVNCSIQNSMDDNGCIWDACERITFRRCLFSGGYEDFTKGMLVGVYNVPPRDLPDYVTIDQCLFAFMKGRAPELAGGTIQFVNNVVCGSRQGGGIGQSWGNFVNNYFLTLPNHPWGDKADRLLTGDPTGRDAAFYFAGNVQDGVPEDRHLLGVRNKAQTDFPDHLFRSTPWPGLPAKLLTADEALRTVLDRAGCIEPVRDEHDHEVIRRVRERIGLKN